MPILTRVLAVGDHRALARTVAQPSVDWHICAPGGRLHGPL